MRLADRFAAARDEWLREPAFEPFRTADKLRELPPSERAAWKALWLKVSELSGVPNPAAE